MASEVIYKEFKIPAKDIFDLVKAKYPELEEGGFSIQNLYYDSPLSPYETPDNDGHAFSIRVVSNAETQRQKARFEEAKSNCATPSVA